MDRYGASEQVLVLCEDHGYRHMPVTGPPLGGHQKLTGESDMYIFSKLGFREAVNKARDFKRSEKVSFYSNWIPFHKITYSLFPISLFLSLSVPVQFPTEYALVFIYLCPEWSRGGARIHVLRIYLTSLWAERVTCVFSRMLARRDMTERLCVLGCRGSKNIKSVFPSL